MSWAIEGMRSFFLKKRLAAAIFCIRRIANQWIPEYRNMALSIAKQFREVFKRIFIDPTDSVDIFKLFHCELLMSDILLLFIMMTMASVLPVFNSFIFSLGPHGLASFLSLFRF